MRHQADQTEAVEAEGEGEGSPGDIVVSVCTTCKSEDPDAGQKFLAATSAAVGANATVRAVQCLGVCKRPGTVAVTAPDRYTFIFGDLVGDAGASAIASFVASFAKANLGLVPWRERPEIIRRGLVARIPPAIWSPADGKPPT